MYLKTVSDNYLFTVLITINESIYVILESSNDETSELIETVIEELDPNQMNSNGHTNDLNVDTVKKSSENDVLLQLNGHHIDIIEAPSVKIIKPLNTSSPLLAESNGIID